MTLYTLPKQYGADFKNPRKKPIGDVEIDWNNPISKGMLAYTSPNIRTPKLTGTVGFSGTSISSGTTAISVTQKGKSLHATSSGSSIKSDRQYAGVGTGDLTFFSSVYVRDLPTTFSYLISLNNVTGIAFRTTPKFYFFLGGAINGTTTAQANTFYTVAGVRRNGTAHIYVNAVSEASAANSTNIASNELILLAYNDVGDFSFSNGVEILNSAYFNRALSESELKSLHDNNFQLEKPKSPPVYFTSEAAGGITITADSQDYNVSFYDAVVDLTGEISVNGGAQSHNITFYDAVIDLTGEVLVSANSQSYNVQFYDGQVGLISGIEVQAQTQDYNVNFFDATVQLSGEILVSAASQGYSVTFYDATVSITELWTDKPPVNTNWADQANTATIWTDK